MLIRVLPTQIPNVWDQIKFASKTVLGLNKEKFQDYCVRLIHQLLSDRAQCFVRLNDKRRLQAIFVTRVIEDYYTKEKSLFFDFAYSTEAVTLPVWENDLDKLKKFANSIGCKKIEGCTAVPRLKNILTNLGFDETTTTYSIEC